MYLIISVCLVLFSLVALFAAYKLLVKQHWFIAWVKGTSGVVLVLFAGLLILMALDISSYLLIEPEKEVASISMIKKADQKYMLEVSIPSGGKYDFEISGDLWQLDARILSWSGPFGFLGVKPGYKLDRISGRYLSLEDERSKPRSVFNLEDPSVLDIWSFLKSNSWMPWLEPQYGSAAYLPLSDGAIYSVLLAEKGLIAKPVNDTAMKAIQDWQ